MKAKSLTNVPASGVQLGEGAYLSPGPGQWTVAADYWLCLVTADSDQIKAVPKLWIPEFLPQPGPPPPPPAGLFYANGAAARNAYIVKNKMDPAKTLLFSKISGSNPILYQLLIPPGYLKGSGLMGGFKNSGLVPNVACYPKTTDKLPTSSAPWGTWAIPGFGQG